MTLPGPNWLRPGPINSITIMSACAQPLNSESFDVQQMTTGTGHDGDHRLGGSAERHSRRPGLVHAAGRLAARLPDRLLRRDLVDAHPHALVHAAEVAADRDR